MHHTLKVIQAAGFPLNAQSRIVDLGCGAGRFIKTMRAAGFDAQGCDIYEAANDDAAALRAQGLIKSITFEPYRLPYDDASVDYIVSETVLEHVMNPEEVALEMARVLKPGGAAFHFFPARYAPIESHIFVPFASFIQHPLYLKFWALLGLRNGYQKGMNAEEVTANNAAFLKNNTNYLTDAQMRAVYGPHFARVDFIEDTYLGLSESPKARALARLNKYVPFAGWAYRKFWAVPLLLVKA